MAWDDIARHDHRRVCARYPSDMTDREWAIIAPLLPPARSGGRPRTVDLRAVVDAILFIASSGCQWRMLPKDFPPRSTVQGYFYDWRDSRLWETINQLLVTSRACDPPARTMTSRSCGGVALAGPRRATSDPSSCRSTRHSTSSPPRASSGSGLTLQSVTKCANSSLGCLAKAEVGLVNPHAVEDNPELAGE